MLNAIKKSMQYNQSVNMIYMDDSGAITKRRVKPFKICGNTFMAYCYVRKSKRTFKIDNVLAVVPISKREGMVV